MKKGLKKLITGAATAIALALPVATITAGADAGQEAKANTIDVSLDNIVSGLENLYGPNWQDKIWEDWYSGNNGHNHPHLKPPSLLP